MGVYAIIWTKQQPVKRETWLGLNLVYDVVSGMEYIYSKGVEHRDLKADNVLLDEESR